MSDYSSKQLESILQTSENLWWPEFSEKTISQENSLATGYAYSTTGVLSDYKTAPELMIPLQGIENISLELIPNTLFLKFIDQGLVQLKKDKIKNESNQELIKNALLLLNSSPSLFITVNRLIKSIHLLDTQPGYDVSFTDPNIKHSVFVSLPLDQELGVFRLAESILHEAMHLQLTLIEDAVNLISNYNQLFYSPWKKSKRSIYGILHGVYVFSVIYQWLDYIEASENGLIFSQKRKLEILNEIKSIDINECLPALTPTGKFLFNKMMSVF